MLASIEDERIETLDFSTRSYNVLRRAGYKRVIDLIPLGEAEYRKLRNMGTKSCEEIMTKMESYLRAHGISREQLLKLNEEASK